MFIALGLSAGAPIVGFKCLGVEAYLVEYRCLQWSIGGAIYIGGAILYAFKCPERFFPKRFDLLGASH